MKIAIVGSRNYPDLEVVRQFVREQPTTTCIVSGGAKGVDRAAEDEARRRGLEVEIHFPDWDVHGKSAGFIRNRAIVESADEVVAFWDGTSRGTKHSIDLAHKAGKPVRVIQSEPEEIPR